MAKDDFLDLDDLDQFDETSDTSDEEVFEEIVDESSDDLLAEDDSKKNKKEKIKKQKDTSNKPKKSIGKILLTSVLPAVVTLGVGMFFGIQLGGASTESTVKPIEAISNKVSLEDRVSNIKDSQMSALNAQIANLLKNTTDVDNKAAVVNGLINQAVKDNLNNLMGAVLADNPNKSDAERVANIKQYFDINENTSSNLDIKLDDYSQQVKNNLESFVDSNSLAKQLGTNTAKAGNVFASILAVDRDLSTIYQVIVPTIANDSTVYETLYIVRVSSSNKVTAMSYIGYVNGDEGTGYYDSMEQLIKNKIENGENENGSTQTDTSDIKQNTEGVVKENKSATAKTKSKDKTTNKSESSENSENTSDSSETSSESSQTEQSSE